MTSIARSKRNKFTRTKHTRIENTLWWAQCTPRQREAIRAHERLHAAVNALMAYEQRHSPVELKHSTTPEALRFNAEMDESLNNSLGDLYLPKI